MEPAQAKVRYVITAEVMRLTQESDGRWFSHFAGSWESLCLGNDRPDFKVGDYVRITIERTEHPYMKGLVHAITVEPSIE